MAVFPELFFFFLNSGGAAVAASESDFLVYAGDSSYRIFQVLDVNGDAYPLGGLANITIKVQRDLESAIVISKELGSGVVLIGDGSTGQFRVDFDPADTVDLTAFYIYAARLIDGSGAVATGQLGRFQVGQAPIWTYSGDPRSSDKDAVRFLIGDTVSKDPLLQDAEILFALASSAGRYAAAATLCRSLAARMSREADVVDRDLRTALSTRARSFLRMAAEYENRSLFFGPGLPYAGGISIADKVLQEDNPDRVEPQYNLGMDDNLIPVAPAGNETPI